MTEGDAVPTALAQQVGRALLQSGWRLISAESCTGGLLAASMTDIPGSSNWFEGAFVTYRLSAKTDMVGVSEAILNEHGPVSEPVARAMAEGALTNSHADIAVSITGVAGPDGGDVISPVGTVWFAWAIRDEGSPADRTAGPADRTAGPADRTAGPAAAQIRCVQTAEHHLAGSRQAVRSQAVRIALEGVLELT